MDSLTQFIGALLGGLGLFLLAVGMMTDGLKQTAGNSLRKLLAYWTNSSHRGVLSGFLMTAMVQSSSAITVATIGLSMRVCSLCDRRWVLFTVLILVRLSLVG